MKLDFFFQTINEIVYETTKTKQKNYVFLQAHLESPRLLIHTNLLQLKVPVLILQLDFRLGKRHHHYMFLHQTHFLKA